MALIVDKYAPTNLESMILNSSIKSVLEEMVKDPYNKFKNMTLTGVPGIGKTALAKALVKQIGAECLFLNASKENNVDTIRSKVSDFCGSISLADQIKVVILDEADCLSVGKMGGAGAQEVLRGLIEEHQNDCRFILTCNYVNRIIPALISRCPIINVQFTPELVLERVKTILKSEQVKVGKSALTEFYETVIKSQFPKVRNILHSLDCCIKTDGTFDVTFSGASSDNKALDEFVEQLYKLIVKKNSKARQIRQFYTDNSEIFEDDYEVLANELFEKFIDEPMIQISIADYIFKMSNVMDKEIMFYSMILDIQRSRE